MYKYYAIAIFFSVNCFFVVHSQEYYSEMSNIQVQHMEKLIQQAVKKTIDNEKPYLPIQFLHKARTTVGTVITLSVITGVLYIYWRWPKESDLQKFEENLNANGSESLEQIFEAGKAHINALDAQHMQLKETLQYFQNTLNPGMIYIGSLGQKFNDDMSITLQEEQKTAEALGTLHTSIGAFSQDLDEGKKAVLASADAAEETVKKFISQSVPLPGQGDKQRRSMTRTNSAAVGLSESFSQTFNKH